jgi:hypothetical protein
MKKLVFFFALVLMTVFLIPNQLRAGTGDDKVANSVTKTVVTDKSLQAESEALIARLEEINEMDKSELTRSEKRELRKEVRQIDKTLAINDGGIYLSVGAIIIVILLLILLL